MVRTRGEGSDLGINQKQKKNGFIYLDLDFKRKIKSIKQTLTFWAALCISMAALRHTTAITKACPIITDFVRIFRTDCHHSDGSPTGRSTALFSAPSIEQSCKTKNNHRWVRGLNLTLGLEFRNRIKGNDLGLFIEYCMEINMDSLLSLSRKPDSHRVPDHG